MYESRLKIPHATDKTFSDYSSFITKYDQFNYENIMIETNKYVSETKNKYYERDRYENALSVSGNALNKFMDYIEFEKKQKKPVVNLIRTLYERAIAYYYLDSTLWENYMLFLVDTYLADKRISISFLIKTAERSVRNCSWSGDLWSHYIRILEINSSPPEEIADIYNRALSIGMLKNNIDDFIKVIISNVDCERRKILIYKGSISQENGLSLVNLLEEGIKMVKETFQTSDPYYRLEKYLIEIETLKKDLPKARQVWEELNKYHRNESEFWIQYANWEKNVGNLDYARKVYRKASQQNTEWPERIFDAWEQFEHQYGNVDNLEHAMIFIKKQTAIVAKRREKATLKETQSAQSEGLSQIVPNDESLETTNSISSEQYFDTKKRKPEEDEQTEGLPIAKRNKAQQFEKPKRDREFATIVVSNLPLDAKEGELKSIFHECGKIKEIRFLADTANSWKTAYVEFNEKESVPAALTKDKKRLHDQEISVYTTSERTLFVTNFPAHIDIEELFKKYGEIFSVRKPNPKYRKRGVFCYVEFKERESAQAALEMDGRELEPGKKIHVVISNPLLKKERSPPTQTEVCVRNLPGDVEQSELKSLFQPYGAVKHVRIPMTDESKCRGLAFVEFENKDHAKASLTLNLTEFKGCILNVTLSEINRNRNQEDIVNEREKNKKFKRGQEKLRESEKQSKTVVFTKLPKDITEKSIRNMLSQNFKDEAISKITMSQNRCAYVEFEHIEEAGRAVLAFNKYKLNDATISAATHTEFAVQREDKPIMVPRKLIASSSKLGSGSSKKAKPIKPIKNSTESNQDVEMKDKDISKKSNNDFRDIFYNTSN